MNDTMEELVDNLLAENEDAIAAYDAILERGAEPSFARAESVEQS